MSLMSIRTAEGDLMDRLGASAVEFYLLLLDGGEVIVELDAKIPDVN